MTTLLTPSNILFVLSLLGVLFTVYNYFRTPQIETDKRNAISAELLTEITRRLVALEAAFNLHTNNDQSSFTGINQHLSEVDKSIVRLTTIIDERIPKST